MWTRLKVRGPACWWSTIEHKRYSRIRTISGPRRTSPAGSVDRPQGRRPMTDIRIRFHEELAQVEAHVQSMGAASGELFGAAVRALVNGDPEECDRVIGGDDLIDEFYLRTEERIINLFALQTPVASDLRLLTVL